MLVKTIAKATGLLGVTSSVDSHGSHRMGHWAHIKLTEFAFEEMKAMPALFRALAQPSIAMFH